MSDLQVALAAAVLAVGCWWHPAVPAWAVLLAVAGVIVVRRPWLVVVALLVTGTWWAGRAVEGLEPLERGRVEAEATVLSDPRPTLGGVALDLRLPGGAHVGAEAAGPAANRLAGAEAGDRVALVGRVEALDDAADWAVARHLRGRLVVNEVVRVRDGSAPFRAANRIRRVLRDGTDTLDPAQRSLYLGLVVGDDREQDELMQHRFRASGLGHLLAVSGQNVAFVLVAASPLLSRLRLRSRWCAVVAVLALFTLVTRWEPSVLRAVVMAGVVATVTLLGRYASGLRIVSVAVVALLVADPLLARSLGFRLSVAATLALVVVARPLARRLPGPDWFVVPLSVVLAAQLGTAPLLLLAGDTLSVASLPANLLAVPVAGWVMVWGLTVGLVSAWLPFGAQAVAHAPTRAMLWWVDHVADLAASPRWPRVGPLVYAGLLGAVAVAALIRGRWRRLATAPVFAAAVALVWPSGPGSVGASGAVLHRGDRAAVLVVSGSAQVAAVLDLITADGCPTAVVVTSGRTRPAALVAALREVCGQLGVAADDPDPIDGARALVEGTADLGGIDLIVERDEGRWRVRLRR